MPMRLSGLMSGMDTETIIQELVAAKRTKVDSAVKAQTKIQWKQDAWKELNSKLKNLQSKFVNNMRWSSAYSKKTTSVSNSSIVSVITGENAVNGVQSLKVEQLAKTGYLTGAQLKDENGDIAEYTALTKLSEITIDSAGNKFSGSGTFTINTGEKRVDISVNGDTTISDVLDQLKSAGVNANFDSKNQRFFVSAKESGLKNDFSITASDADGAKALAALGLQTDLNTDKATGAQYQTYHDYYVAGDRDQTIANMRKLIDKSVSDEVDKYVKQYQSASDAKNAAQKSIDEINQKYADKGITLKSVEEYAKKLEELEEASKNTEDEELKATLNEQKKTLTEEKKDAESLVSQNKVIADADATMTDISSKYLKDISVDGDGKYTASASDSLVNSIEDSYYAKASYAYDVIEGNASLGNAGATKVNGQNAIIELNDAKFENGTNVFEINGLTFTALSETKGDETVTVTTQNDTDGIYDMLKDFLKEYNSIINELDKLYNADSASGYEPLTSDEKESMSESEIDEWETKIKDALLRKDSNVNTVSSALKEVMSSGFTINGKEMYLSDFGIATLGYFEAADNEKNAYHIDGDPDDSHTSGKSDVLKGLIASDPDTVISFFTQLSQKLYSKMTDMSKSVDGYRSFGSFYDDKKMQTDYNDYKTKIADLEEKLNDYEDKWYKKFSAMETALAKMQSKTNALTGLLGGS